MQRTYDTRRIKSNRSYTVSQLAELLDVSSRTVHDWTRQGLPVIDDHHRKMMHGPAIREWLNKRQAARRWPCGPGQLPCFGCKGPRGIKSGTFKVKSGNTLKIRIEGQCIECGRTIGRGDVKANLTSLEREFGLIQQAENDASIASNPTLQTPLNHDIKKDMKP